MKWGIDTRSKAEWIDSKIYEEKYNEEGSAQCSLRILTDTDFCKSYVLIEMGKRINSRKAKNIMIVFQKAI